MSTTTDKRIVEMQFKNDQFERGVQTSMNTLDKLKKSLNMDSAASGLQKIGDTAKNISLETLASSVDAISNRFSTMGIIGMTALQNITNSAINAGKQLVSSLTIDPVKQGFSEYELKMGSVQTIMAGTGESLETVMDALNELNTYADKTIYSFSDMTSNIGKFTNAGVSLKDAVAAIQGVSNEAAVSGANANEASRAMYNFAQALSAGYVKLIDWKSIENANMATKEFKQQLIDTAVSLGTLTEQNGEYVTSEGTSITSTKNFNDSLQDAWMTTDVLTQTLAKYSDATTDIGKKAYAAAQDVKTFSQLIDTMKEAVGSGWATTFEIIIGDFDEAKELFTEISNTMGDIIQKSADHRNNLLKGALGTISAVNNSAFHEMYDSVLNAANGLVDQSVWNTVRQTGYATDALKDAMIEAAVAAGDLTEKEGYYITATGTAYDKANLFSSALKDGWLTSSELCTGLQEVAEEEVEAAQNVESTLEPFKDEILEVAEAKGILDASMSTDEQWTDLLNNGKLTNDILDEVIDKLENKMSEAAASGKQSIEDLSDATFNCGLTMQEVSDYAMQVIRGDWGNGQERIDALNAAGLDRDTIQSYVDYLLKSLGEEAEATDYYWYSQLNLNEAIKENLDFTSDQVEALEALQTAAENAGMSLEDYIKQATRPTGRELLIDSMKNSFEALKKVLGAVKDAFADIFPAFGSEPLYKIIEAFDNFTKKLIMSDETADNLRRTFKGLFAVVDILIQPIKLLASLFVDLVKFLAPAASGTLEVTGSLGDCLAKFDSFIKESGVFQTALNGIESALKPIAEGLKTFAGFVKDVVVYLLDWASGNDELTESMDKASSAMEGYNNAAKVAAGIGTVFVTIGTAFKNAALFIRDSFIEWTKIPTVSKNLSNFQSAFKNFGSVISGIAEPLGDAFQEFSERTQALGEINLSNIGSVIVDFFQTVGGAFFGKLGEAFQQLGPAFQTMFSDIGKALEDFGAKHPLFQEFLDFFKGIWDQIVSIFQGVKGQNGEIGSTLTTFTSNFDTFSDAMSGIKDALGTSFGTIGKFLSENFGSIAAILAGIAAFKGIKSISNIIDGLVDAVSGFGSLISSLATLVSAYGKVLKAAALKIIMDAVTNFIKALIPLFVELAVMAQMDINKLWQAFAVMAAMVGIITGVVALMAAMNMGKGILGNVKNMATIGTTILAFGAAMTMIAIALRSVDGLQNVAQDLIIFAAAFASLIALVKIVAANPIDAGKTVVAAGVLVAFALSIRLIIGALKSIDVSNPEQLVGQLVVLSGLLFEMMVVVDLLGDMDMSSANMASVLMLISFALSLKILVGVIDDLGSMDFSVLFVGIMNLQLLILDVIAICDALSAASAESLKAGIAMTAIGVALLLMAESVKIIGNMKASVIAKGLLALYALEGFIEEFIIFSNFAGANATKAGLMMMGISASLLILSGVIFILGNMDPAKVAVGVIAINLLEPFFESLISIGNQAKTSLKSIVAITGCVTVLGVMVAALAMIDSVRLLAATAALDSIMGMLALLIKVSNTRSKIKTKTLVEMVAIIAAVGAIFVAFDALGADGTNMLLMTTAVSEALLAACAVFEVINHMGDLSVGLIGKAAIFGAAVDVIVGVVAGGLTAIFGAIGGIVDALGAEQAILDGIRIVKEVLEGLGEAIGGFVGGIAEGFSEKLPAIGDNLSSFGRNIRPFFTVLNSLSEESTKKMAILTGCIMGLTSSDISYGIAQFFHIAPTLSDFGGEISEFGDALSTFLENIDGLSEDDLTRVKIASEAIKNLSEGLSSLPQSGGIFDIFDGQAESMDQFGKDMRSFGQAIVDFAETLRNGSLTGDDISMINQASSAAKGLADLCNQIPKEGGMFDAFTGTSNIADWGDDLVAFGDAMVKFADTIAPLDVDSGSGSQIQMITDLMTPVKDLIAASNDIENSGGLLAAIVGDNTFTQFGEQLVDLGAGLSGFCEEASDIDEDAIEMLKTLAAPDGVLQSLNDVAANMTKSGGLGALLAGDSTLTKLGDQIAGLGQGLADFKSNLGVEGFTTDDHMTVYRAARAAGVMVEFTKDLNAGTAIQDGQLAEVAGQFGAFCNGIAKMATELKDVSSSDWTNISSLGTALSAFRNSGDGLSAIKDTFTVWDTSDLPDKMDNLAKALNSYAKVTDGVSYHDIYGANQCVDEIQKLVDKADDINFDTLDEFDADDSGLIDFGGSIKQFASDCKEASGYSASVIAMGDSVDEIADMAKTLTGIQTDTFSTVVDNLNTVVSLVGAMNDTDTSNVQEFIDAIGNFSGDLIANFVDGFETGTEGATEAVYNLITDICGVVNERTGDMKTYGQLASDALIDGLNDFTEDEYDIVGKIFDSLDSNLMTMETDFKGIGQQANSWIADGLWGDDSNNILKSDLSTVTESINNLYSLVNDSAKINNMDTLAKSLGTLQDAVQAINESDTSNVQGYTDALKDMIEGCLSDIEFTFDSHTSPLKDKIQNFFDNIYAEMSPESTNYSTMKTVGRLITEAITDGMDQEDAKTQFVSSCESLMNELGKQYMAKEDEIEQIGTDIVDTVSDGLVTAVEALNTSIDSKMAETVNGAFDDALDNDKGQFDEFLQECNAALSDANEVAAFRNAASALGNSFGTGLSNFYIDGSAHRLASKAANAMRSAYYEMRDVGQYIAQGLADGLTNNTGAVETAARSVVNDMFIAAQAEADSHSPSKRAMKLGGFVTEGLAIGLIEASNLVEEAATDVTNTMFENIVNPLAAIQDVIDMDGDLNPVITPVMDLSMLTAGVSQMNDMIDNSSLQYAIPAIAGSTASDATNANLQTLAAIGQSILTSINNGGDIYLNENLIIGRINRRLGML